MSNTYSRLVRLFGPVNFIPIALALVGIAIFPYLAVRFTSVRYDVVSSIQTALYVLLGLVVVAIVLRALLIYLEPVSTLKSFTINNAVVGTLSDRPKALSDQLAEIKDQIKSIGTVEFDINESQLLETLRATIDQRFTESVLKSIDEEFAKRDLQNKQWERFITGFEEIRKRLYEETDNLARRANLNLALGTITTILAGIGLVAIVFLRPLELVGLSTDEYGWRIIAHYIPRLSLIVFAELFAYFFLRLYKTGLADIKYYQNELTNVELKISALKVALAIKDNEILKLVVGELAKAERNFILKKDETTVELEKSRNENINTREWMNHLTALLGSKK